MIKKIIFFLFILLFLNSCIDYRTGEKIGNLLYFPHYKDCDDYEFILHFVDEALSNPDNIYEISKKYPISINKKILPMIRHELKDWNFSIQKLHKNGKINKIHQLCYQEPGYGVDLYRYRQIEIIWEIEGKDLFLGINFYQYSKNAKFVLGWMKVGGKGWFPEI